ncbi:hypothetical protein QUA44_27795 [Microcoleus sp. N9_A2]|uniref:hypothetical protein n=1 Tax=unclassified Microcoleus TaxID=2642155 RepID=UPI002FD5D943
MLWQAWLQTQNAETWSTDACGTSEKLNWYALHTYKLRYYKRLRDFLTTLIGMSADGEPYSISPTNLISRTNCK